MSDVLTTKEGFAGRLGSEHERVRLGVRLGERELPQARSVHRLLEHVGGDDEPRRHGKPRGGHRRQARALPAGETDVATRLGLEPEEILSHR